MPLELTPHQLLHVLKGRATVQPPGPEDEELVKQIAQAGPREGIPFDVLMTLESLRQLAEQGNTVAARVYDVERRKLGIDVPLVVQVDRAP